MGSDPDIEGFMTAEQKAAQRREISEEKARQRRELEMTRAHDAVEDAHIELAHEQKIKHRSLSVAGVGAGLMFGTPFLNMLIDMTMLMLGPIVLGLIMLVSGGSFIVRNITEGHEATAKKKLRDAERRLRNALTY